MEATSLTELLEIDHGTAAVIAYSHGERHGYIYAGANKFHMDVLCQGDEA